MRALTQQQAAELVRKQVEGRVNGSEYKVWLVGDESENVHITCTEPHLRAMQYAADQLIASHGGMRYMASINPVGVLGRSNEATFCFKLDDQNWEQ